MRWFAPWTVMNVIHDHFQRFIWGFFGGFLVPENKIVTGWSENKGVTTQNNGSPGGTIVIVTGLWWKERSRNIVNELLPSGCVAWQTRGACAVTPQVTTCCLFYKDLITVAQGFFTHPWQEMNPVNILNPSYAPWQVPLKGPKDFPPLPTMSLDTSYENVDVVHGYVDVEVKILKLMIVLFCCTFPPS